MQTFFEKFSTMPDMKFLPEAKKAEISTWEAENKIALPADYKGWLLFSDGGEIFIPGLQLYGVSHKPLLTFCNQQEQRDDLPEELIIIGEFGFGDLLCFKKGTETIIQWDHEAWEEFMSWNSFKAFMSEAEELLGEEA